MSDPVLVERLDDGIVVVRLNRPEVLNALDEPMLVRFTDTLEALNRDESCRAVVLAAAGGRAFSAGQDLATAQDFDETNIGDWFRRLGRLYQSVRALDKPSVVALEGVAAGFGFQVALHADVRVAHPGVRMAQPEVAAGIPSGLGLWIIREVVGLARAVELSLTCRFVEAEECLEWGLVDHLVPTDQVMPKALEIARTLAAKPAFAFRLSKQRMRSLTQADYDAAVEAAVAVQTAAFATGEPRRVGAAFLAARAARRKGG